MKKNNIELVDVFAAFAELVNTIVEEHNENPEVRKKINLLGRRLNRFSKKYCHICNR